MFSPPMENICTGRCYLLSCKNVLVPSTETHRARLQIKLICSLSLKVKTSLLKLPGRRTLCSPSTSVEICCGTCPFGTEPRVSFPRGEKMLPHSLFFSPPTPKNKARCSDLGAQQGGSLVEDKPTAIRSTYAVLPVLQSPPPPLEPLERLPLSRR